MGIVSTFFGEAWDAPCCDPPAVQVRTPVGASCRWCRFFIRPSDCGFSLPTIGYDGGGGAMAISQSYTHRECYFAEMCGHLVGVCGCTGFLPSRTAAVVAWGRWQTLRTDRSRWR